MSRNPKKNRDSRTPSGKDSMSLYLEEVSKYPRLSRPEEVECSALVKAGEEAQALLDQDPDAPNAAELRRAIERGQEALHKLVNHNLRLVVSISRDFKRSQLPLEDLISAGNEGLMHAARKYDGSLGVPFGNYAPFWIKQRLQKFATEQGFATRIPQYRAAGIHRIMRVAANLMQELGREATPQEIAAYTEYSLAEVEEVLRILQPTIELDAVVSEDGTSGEVGSFFGESVDEAAGREDEAIEQIDLQRVVENALDTLPPREAQVLAMYFGLRGHVAHDLDEIGKVMGFTRERARQLRAAGLKRLAETGALPDLRGL